MSCSNCTVEQHSDVETQGQRAEIQEGTGGPVSWASHRGHRRSNISKSMHRMAQLAHELPAVPHTLNQGYGKDYKASEKVKKLLC